MQMRNATNFLNNTLNKLIQIVSAMMKFTRNSLTILLVFISINGFSQQWLWSRQFKTAQPSILGGLELDANNNVFVTGQFKASTNIGPGINIVPQVTNNTDFFLAKYNSSNVLQWHVELANSAVSAKVNAKNVVVDASGNPIVCGFFDHDINSGVDVTIPVYKAGKADIFMAKYGANGSRTWIKRAAWGPGDVKAQWLSIAPDGSLYLTGVSADTVYFTGTTLTSTGGKVINFIAKYSNTGTFIFATQINYSSTDVTLNKFVEINAASSDEIYMGGFFAGTMSVGGITLNSVTSNHEDAVLLKFNGSGDVQWARQAGGIYDDRCNGVSTDIYGNVYLIGYVTTSARIDSTGNGTLDSSPMITNGAEDMLVAKYNKNGRLFWKKTNGDVGMDKGYGAFIHENIVMFAGNFAGTVHFNNTTITSSSTTNQDPGFFVYDVDGNPITAKSIAGDDNNDRTELITYDNNGNSYVGGLMTSTHLTIGDSVYTNSGGSGNNNGFIAKYHNPFSATFTSTTNVACTGGSNGKLIVTPYFGVGPYTYQWSANVTNSLDSAATGLSAGTYSVTVTDSRDSIASTSKLLSPGSSAIVIGLAKTDLNCFQSADGGINLTVSGGTPSYTYNWTGASGYIPTAKDQTGLSAGFYKVTITDQIGCSKNDSVIITQPEPILFGTSVVTAAIPSGSHNGKIDVNLTGGTPAYSYAWARDGSDLPGRTNDTINNLNGGTYQVTVTDANSCNADTAFIVKDLSLLQIEKTITNVSCNGLSNGSAYVSITNKNPIASYSYLWSTGAIDSSIFSVGAGNYQITVTETGGLNRSLLDTVKISQPNPLNIVSMIPTMVNCYGASTGSIAVSITGGTQVYSYNWSSGQSTESISLIPAGHYILTVSDANSCQTIDTAYVLQNDSLSFSYSLQQPIRCFGLANGIVRVNVTGGQGPYTYQWDDPGLQTNNTATGLLAGTYHVVTTDALSCIDTGTYKLTQPEKITFASIDTTNVSCYNFADGKIHVKVQGGITPYTYDWSPNMGSADSITGLAAGITYSLTVTDDNFCINNSFSYTIKRPSDPLTLKEDTVSRLDNKCFGFSDGQVVLISTGGWGNNEYNLKNVGWQSSPVFNSLRAATYVATVRDEGGCSQNDIYVTISEPTELTADPPFVINNIILLSASGGTLPRQYSLDGGVPQASGQFNNVPGGNHTITVTDANNCELVVAGIVITAVETINDVKYNIFPNPSEGVFNLQLSTPFDKNYNVQIYNITGGLVYENNKVAVQQNGSTNLSVDITDKGHGIFIIKLNGIPLKEKLIVR